MTTENILFYVVGWVIGTIVANVTCVWWLSRKERFK